MSDQERLDYLLKRKIQINREIRELQNKLKTSKTKLQEDILNDIRAGKVVTSNGDRQKDYALRSLKYRGIIENQGNRRNPVWVIIEKVKVF